MMDQLAAMDIVGRHFANNHEHRPSHYHRQVMTSGRTDAGLLKKGGLIVKHEECMITYERGDISAKF